MPGIPTAAAAVSWSCSSPGCRSWRPAGSAGRQSRPGILTATAAVLPGRVTFPAVGPSLYLVSELTAEGKAPAIDLDFQKEKKRGVK
jgi:hypothetical protein